MWGAISPGEASALYRLVAQSPTDLVLKTDRMGRIVHATAATGGLGLAFAGDPVGRHLLELLHPSCSEAVLAEHAAAVRGQDGSGWIEVLVLAQDGSQRWMEMKLGGLPERCGALGLLRSIDERRALEDRLFVAAMTDPLTRLTNREAFVRMLGHLVESGASGHVALFDLDHFRASCAACCAPTTSSAGSAAAPSACSCPKSTRRPPRAPAPGSSQRWPSSTRGRDATG
jgi:PAS domain S-box-containing protein